MSKRSISLIMALVMCMSMFSTMAYAKENKAYQEYKDAIQATTSSGSWSEELTVIDLLK